MAEAMSASQGLTVAGDSAISSLIYTVRGKQVMLDSDLAKLYQVETKRINEAVRRNPGRFPEEFCFRLSFEDAECLRSQIATLNPEQEKQSSWWRYAPQVFTEQGVAMLSAVLRSDVAVEVSVRIMNSFVEMRRFIANNSFMFEQIRAVELRQLEYQKSTDARFERVFDYMESHATPSQRVFFDGQVYDAFEFLIELVQLAKRRIVLIDGYVDTGTLNLFAKKGDGVAVEVWTRPSGRLTRRDVATFNAQYPPLELKETSAFHDRFLILDDEIGYFVGASLKDAGKKSFAVVRIEDRAIVDSLLKRLKDRDE